MAKMIKKGDLPSKICAACGLAFAWRKKWARDWAEVKFCSDRCRSAKAQPSFHHPGMEPPVSCHSQPLRDDMP